MWIPTSSTKRAQLSARAITWLGTNDICEYFQDLDKDLNFAALTNTSSLGTAAFGTSTFDLDTTAGATRVARFASSSLTGNFPIPAGTKRFVAGGRMKFIGSLVAGDKAYFEMSNSGGTEFLRVGCPANTVFWSASNAYDSLVSTTALDSGVWHELFCVSNGTVATLYLDGVSIATGAFTGLGGGALLSTLLWGAFNTAAGERVQWSNDWVYAACRRADV